MFDAKIISACIASRGAYNTIAEHVDTSEFTPAGKFWWGQVKAWYDADPQAPSVDAEMLSDAGARSAGRNAQAALEWFHMLPPPVSPDNVARELLLLKREIKYREYCGEMEGERDDARILPLIDSLHELHHMSELGTADLELTALSGDFSRGPLTPIFPYKLNEVVEGGCEDGTHVVVFARVEIGKTLFSINNVGNWLRRGLKVMYAGNEESPRMIEQRIKSNLCNATVGQMVEEPEKARARAIESGLDNLLLVNLADHGGGTPDLLDRFVSRYEPDCLVVDQLRNMRGGSRGTRAQALDVAASGVRQLTNSHGIVTISVGQANAGEHNKPKVWLEPDDFDESRTGVPGSADLMIGMGADAAMKAHNTRAFTVCKNKLTGRHDTFTCRIDPPRNKIKG